MQPVALAVLPLALAALPSACGGSGSGGPKIDAALGSDASEVLPDAGATTSCGVEGDLHQCDRATQICVETELGAGLTYQCVTLPTGCDTDRTCAACSDACMAPADTCDDTGDDNTILCSCPTCV